MKVRQTHAQLGIMVSAVVLGLAGFSVLAASCTDGATPDCTGDAAATCGLMPNEGGSSDDGSTADDGGNGTDAQGTDANQSDDTGSTTDAQTDDGGDSGDAGGD